MTAALVAATLDPPGARPQAEPAAPPRLSELPARPGSPSGDWCDEDLVGLLPRVTSRSLREGEALQPGGETAGLWLVVQGRLGVASDQGPHLVGVLLPGDLACVDAETGPALVALTRTVLVALPPVGGLTGAGAPRGAFLRVLAGLAAHGRRQADLRADQLRGPLAARLARTLLDLAERCGVPEGDGLLVDHGLTQEQLGELVGACRESVNKALGDLSRGDALDVLPRAVLLRRPDALRERAVAAGTGVGRRAGAQRIQEGNHMRSRQEVTGIASAVSTGHR